MYQKKPIPMLHEANGRVFSAFTATAHVRRFQWYFFTNVTFPVGLISGLSLVQFSMPPSSYGKLGPSGCSRSHGSGCSCSDCSLALELCRFELHESESLMRACSP